MDLPKRKFRWMVKTFKDAKQLHDVEHVCPTRPEFHIYADANQSGSGYGEMSIGFLRQDVEVFDEVWLGLIDGDDIFVEEWELLQVKILPGSGELFFHNETEGEMFYISYENMRYKKIDSKWTNWSSLGKTDG